MFHPGEHPALLEQREDLLLVAPHEVTVYRFVPVGSPVLHAVFFREALDLSVTEHGKPRQGGHERGNPEILVVLAETVHRRFLVGVVHEVHEAPEDLGVEAEHVLHDVPVLAVLLGLEHVHEGRVVHPVHTQAPDEVPLHEPEGLGQEERVGCFGCDAVHELAPELHRKEPLEIVGGHAVACPRRDVAAVAGRRIPEALEVSLGKGHGRIEAYDGEPLRNGDGLADHGLANLVLEKVELRRVVPGHARPVVPVVDVAVLAGPPVMPAEDHGRVGAVPVPVLDLDDHPVVLREICSGEPVCRERRVIELDEPVRVLDDPA